MFNTVRSEVGMYGPRTRHVPHHTHQTHQTHHIVTTAESHKQPAEAAPPEEHHPNIPTYPGTCLPALLRTLLPYLLWSYPLRTGSLTQLSHSTVQTTVVRVMPTYLVPTYQLLRKWPHVVCGPPSPPCLKEYIVPRCSLGTLGMIGCSLGF
ncbi:hypothetical protein BGZ63DRAFT_378058 [Mariannaea sp. PMI_226]|nr:hypothetical protein BGZ63DRAFT_378058 [Mariannaea sp. PMI_226]